MSAPQTDVLEPRRRRLLFRATHRGTHENDLMIGGFVRANLRAFAPDELDALDVLLELPDNDLADWLTGRRPIPETAATPMLLRIRQAVLDGCALPAGAGARRMQDQPLPGPAGYPTSAQ